MARTTFKFDGRTVPRGAVRDVRLKISESYTGTPIEMPVRIVRGKRPGPTLFISAALHGNEINGTGIVHELMYEQPPAIVAGTLILLPVVNVFGVEYQDRYMPDGRDLNRNFPGNDTGSLSRRVAAIIFEQVVRRSDYGIDLHSAASQRTNYPNIRGDLTVPGVRKLARAFGCELIVNGKGPRGSMRREACAAGCPTIILEAGEPAKIEPTVLDIGIRGIQNVLVELGMLDDERRDPIYQTRIDRTTWIRAQVGGILRFHVSPGALLEKGQPIATTTSIFGREKHVLVSPADGIVLGMTTLPTVKPGEPVCHVAIPRRRLARMREAIAQRSRGNLHQRIQLDLATNLRVIEPGEDAGESN